MYSTKYVICLFFSLVFTTIKYYCWCSLGRLKKTTSILTQLFSVLSIYIFYKLKSLFWRLKMHCWVNNFALPAIVNATTIINTIDWVELERLSPLSRALFVQKMFALEKSKLWIKKLGLIVVLSLRVTVMAQGCVYVSYASECISFFRSSVCIVLSVQSTQIAWWNTGPLIL